LIISFTGYKPWLLFDALNQRLDAVRPCEK
jgi:hypothetical protein